MDDKRIIELFRRRDERAIEECSKSYGKLLHRVAYNVLGSNEDAEECVQDTLHKLWEGFPREPLASLKAYLVTLTRNTAIQQLRASTAEKRGGGEYSIALSELEGCIPTPSSVEAEVEARALAKVIDCWLAALPAEDRVLFIRRYRLGDSVSDLAEASGMRPHAVSKRLYTLREKLRKHLRKENYIV